MAVATRKYSGFVAFKKNVLSCSTAEHVLQRQTIQNPLQFKPDMIVKRFVTFLQQFVPITDEEIKKVILPAILVRKFKKKEIITHAGEVERYINFIDSGLAKKYYLQEGEEKVVQIAIKGHLISCETSFYTQTASNYTVQAIAPVRMVGLEYHRLEDVFASNHKFERLGRLLNIQMMLLKDAWYINLISTNPKERFLNFMNKYPTILNTIPQKDIASYLNMKPETFSRFKHLMLQQVPVSDE